MSKTLERYLILGIQPKDLLLSLTHSSLLLLPLLLLNLIKLGSLRRLCLGRLLLQFLLLLLHLEEDPVRPNWLLMEPIKFVILLLWCVVDLARVWQLLGKCMDTTSSRLFVLQLDHSFSCLFSL